MKKFVFLIISVVCFMFSCASADRTADLPKLPVSLTAKLSGTDESFYAEITESSCRITFGEQHPLFGTEINLTEGENTVVSGKFVQTVKNGIFPAQEALFKALKAVSENPESGFFDENGIKYAIDEMTIMVYYDEDTKQLTGIGTEENGRRFNFDIIAVNPI